MKGNPTLTVRSKPFVTLRPNHSSSGTSHILYCEGRTNPKETVKKNNTLIPPFRGTRPSVPRKTIKPVDWKLNNKAFIS